MVLGGGGSTGNAWLIGVIAGLFDAGLDVTDADLTIGTSAGSTAAVQIAGATPTELLEAILDAPPMTRPGSARPVTDHLTELNALIAAAVDAADMRRRIGAAALDREAGVRRRLDSTLARDSGRPISPIRTGPSDRCSSRRWMPPPENRSSSTATAESTWWTRWPPAARVAFPIGSAMGATSTAAIAATRTQILAAGHKRVLVLSPFGGRSLHPQEWGMQFAAQVDELRAHGSRVETIFPSSDSEFMFGANAMDLSLRPAAARAGHDLGRAVAEPTRRVLALIWRACRTP